MTSQRRARGAKAPLRALGVVLVVGAVTLPVVLPAVTAQQRAETALVSLADGTDDVAAGTSAFAPDVSADGTTVAFTSAADNLVDDAPAGVGDRSNVYVRDLDTGATELVSVDDDGELFPGGATEASVSGDGNRVAFTADTAPLDPTVVGDVDVERIVFASDEAPGGLFVVSDGDDVEHVAGTEAGDTQPAVSPDRSRVAFVRGGDVFVVDLDDPDAVAVNLTPGTDDDAQPSWSPDGVRIAYASNGEELRIVEVGTSASPGPQTVDLDTGNGSPQFVADPAWSPDATRIAFAGAYADQGGPGTVSDIYVYDGVGEGGPIVFDATSSSGDAQRRPAWAPDGDRIAFQVGPAAGTDDFTLLAVTDLAFSGGEQPLTERPDEPEEADVHDRHPAWSPDGDRIVFSSDRGGVDDLHVVDAGGGEVSPFGATVPDEPAPRTWPAFAPTELGDDTPATITATVSGSTAPSGPIEFRLCGVATEGFPACDPGSQVGPRVELEPTDATTSTASITTTELTPPVGFGERGTWCWQVDYLGGGPHRADQDDDETRLCHTVTKQPVGLSLSVDGDSDDGELLTELDAVVVGTQFPGAPQGVVTVWRCGPDEVTAAGCPEGGVPVAGPLEVSVIDEGFTSGASEEHAEALPSGRYCFRVEYAGDGGYQRDRSWDPADCVTHDAEDNVDANDASDLFISSDPGTVDFDDPVAPSAGDETVTVYGGQGGFENIPVDFSLCGPSEVTRYGCEAGGEVVATGVAWNQGSGTETDRVVVPEPDEADLSQEGVYCWRMDQPGLGRDYTDTTDSCFAVEGAYTGAPTDLGTRVYVRDRQAGTTTLVSVDEEGSPPSSGQSDQPSISDDGTRVAFVSTAPLVDDEAVFGQHVFLRDLDAETTTWVSVSACFGSDCSFEGNSSPAISGDGSAVAFLSSSWQVEAFLPDGESWDGAGWDQVLVHELESGRTTVESLDEAGQPSDAEITSPSLSTDGDRLAFVAEPVFSEGSALTLAVTQPGVWLRDRDAGTDELVSVSVDGQPLVGPPFSGGNAPASVGDAAVSGDGRTVVFSSDAVNLVADDPCAGAADPFCGPLSSVYARDVDAGETRRESVRGDGTLPGSGSASGEPAVDGNGGVIAYSSDASDLVDDVELPAEVTQVYARLRPAGLAIDPDPLTFGEARVDGEPVVRTATVRAAGGRPVTISGVTVSGADATDFSASGCVGTTLAAGEACEVAVTFAPGAVGARTGVLVVTVDTAGVSASADLRGTGVSGGIEVDPTAVTFPARDVGSTSEPRAITVTNVGTASVAVTSVVPGGADPGSFPLVDGCAGTTLAPGDTCTIQVRYRPTTPAAQSAQVLLSHDAADEPEVVTLRGRGQQPDPGPGTPTAADPGAGALTVTPDPVDFGVVLLDAPSPQRVVTVTNTGDADVVVDGFRLTGAGRDRFRVVAGNDTCTGATLEPGRGCGISFLLDTSRTGAPRAVLRVDSDAPEPAAPVTLEGRVPLLEISPTLGPTGFVPEVTGRFFPPDTDLQLTWRTGLGTTEVRTDADGGLRARVLVFRGDRVGPRLVVASRGDEPWATAEYLVVRSSVQPGDFSSRRG